MTYQAIQNDFIPPLIINEQRQAYLELLEQCQMQNDITAFTLFLQGCQAQSLALISSK